MSNLDISKLPPWAKVELTKEDLMAFAVQLMSSNVNNIPEPPQLSKHVLLEVATDILHCSRSKIHRLVKDGKLSVFKINRRNYYSREELLALIENGKQDTPVSEEDSIMAHIRKNQKRKR